MITGSITLNGVDDAALIAILQAKEKSPGLLFNPQLLQPAPVQMRHPHQPAPPNTPQSQRYNNAVLSWGDVSALKTVQEILHRIQPPQPT